MRKLLISFVLALIVICDSGLSKTSITVNNLHNSEGGKTNVSYMIYSNNHYTNPVHINEGITDIDDQISTFTIEFVRGEQSPSARTEAYEDKNELSRKEQTLQKYTLNQAFCSDRHSADETNVNYDYELPPDRANKLCDRFSEIETVDELSKRVSDLRSLIALVGESDIASNVIFNKVLAVFENTGTSELKELLNSGDEEAWNLYERKMLNESAMKSADSRIITRVYYCKMDHYITSDSVNYNFRNPSRTTESLQILYDFKYYIPKVAFVLKFQDAFYSCMDSDLLTQNCKKLYFDRYVSDLKSIHSVAAHARAISCQIEYYVVAGYDKSYIDDIRGDWQLFCSEYVSKAYYDGTKNRMPLEQAIRNYWHVRKPLLNTSLDGGDFDLDVIQKITNWLYRDEVQNKILIQP